MSLLHEYLFVSYVQICRSRLTVSKRSIPTWPKMKLRMKKLMTRYDSPSTSGMAAMKAAGQLCTLVHSFKLGAGSAVCGALGPRTELDQHDRPRRDELRSTGSETAVQPRAPEPRQREEFGVSVNPDHLCR